MPDAIFDHPRIARVYDPLDPDRSDLHTYVNLVDEFGATAVLDVGCGTGTFCCGLADRGIRVLGVDPAGASVAVAQTKAGANRVTWVVGTVLDVAANQSHRRQYDLATMTANVAQVFLEDKEWLANLRAIRTCLRPGGRIAFESRVPSDQAWNRWTKKLTQRLGRHPYRRSPQHTGQGLTASNPDHPSRCNTALSSTGGGIVHSYVTVRYDPPRGLINLHASTNVDAWRLIE
ncbi:SAM-dependent methyltransferase [Arthrobacter sp. CAN_A6]|uniref:class I SAM-dependent methyltransferase n=1 Tax=Arthrobacter sp. CAN_A6 TaxID=2787721 RepID=UPI0018CAA36F